MSGSRKSLKKGAIFNPRASNEWSKDESKFGQKMLEKMGWKHGQGIGLNNQGITENIKVRLKLDNKGLGYQIKEDQWLEVRSEFSELLSQLSQSVEDQDETVIKEKKSLEAVSQSSKTRVHYHKFTHGKDIARYKKEDLIGILGKKENNEELIRSENKTFFHGGNMNEYFKSKKSKSKASDVDVSAEKSLIVDNENNHLNIEAVQEENTSNSQDSISNLNSQKMEKYVETSSNDYENEKSGENKLVDNNSSVQNTESTVAKLDDGSLNSRKRRKSVKKSINDNENQKSEENKSVVENSIVEKTENNKDKELDNIDYIFQKKKVRLSDLSSPFDHQESNLGLSDVNDSKDCTSSQKRKKSKKLLNNNKTEELRKNKVTGEKISHQQIEKTINDGLNLPKTKKNRDKNNTSISEVEPKLMTDNEMVENSSKKKKKKKSLKKSNEASSRAGTAENGNKHDEKQNQSHENETCHNKEKNSSNINSKSTDVSALMEVFDDSQHKLKKRKHESKTLSDIYSSTGENTKMFDTLDRNSEDFMKSVIDYNSFNNVENYILNFEKNRDELMNKYREKYKMKYLMSSSDQIQIFGDEFDGRKLDCKKSNSEEVYVTKILDRKNLSKAEKIVAKARLLKSIKDNSRTHNFEGSNLTKILGYGSKIC